MDSSPDRHADAMAAAEKDLTRITGRVEAMRSVLVRLLQNVVAAESRLERLKHVRVPTLVVHGTEDVLVPIENGRLVAGAVPGARWIEIARMGHDIPERVWSEVADAIEEIAHRSAPIRLQ